MEDLNDNNSFIDLSNTSIQYSEKEDQSYNWDLFWESKIFKFLIGVGTLGIYPLYEWYQGVNAEMEYKQNTPEYFDNLIKQKEKEKFIQGNQEFTNNLIRYINANSNSLYLEKGKKNNILISIVFLSKVILSIVTCGGYLIYSLYSNIQSTKLYNQLNSALSFQKKKYYEDIKQKVDKRLLEEINKAKNINESLLEVEGFNYDNCIAETILSEEKSFEKIPKDPFVLFLFYVSFACLSVISLGAFPAYIYYKKKYCNKKYNFFDYFLSKEIIDKDNFNSRIHSLTNTYDIDFDYAAILTESQNYKSNIYDHNSLFRSFLFKKQINKLLTTIFLSIITLGIYPLYIIHKAAFEFHPYQLLKTSENKLEAINVKDKDYFLNKFKVQLKPLYDFGFDLKIATAIATTKLIKTSNDWDLSEDNSDIGFLFIKVISSTIFKWIFTLIMLLITYLLGSVWIFTYGMSISSWIFPLFFIFGLFFFIAIGYHIFLLF